MGRDTGRHDVVDTASSMRAHQLVVLRHLVGSSTNARIHTVEQVTSYRSHDFEVDRPDRGSTAVPLVCPSCGREVTVTVESVADARRTRRQRTTLLASTVVIGALSLIGAIVLMTPVLALVTAASFLAWMGLVIAFGGRPRYSGLSVEDPGHVIWMKRTDEDRHPDDDW
jgi:hypothetical protein